MKTGSLILWPAAILFSVCALPCKASLVGSQVTGSLTFSGDPSNYFDPNYGFVPATGYLNASGTTVLTSDAAVEFGYDDGESLISADFSDGQLAVGDFIELSGSTNDFQMIFTDSAFAGQSLTLLSSNLSLADYSLLGDSITLDYVGGNTLAGQTLHTSFAIAPTPEPSTFSLISIALFVSLSAFLARRGRPFLGKIS